MQPSRRTFRPTVYDHKSTREDPVNKERVICEKLRKLGFAQERNIRLYGEEFHLISNPIPDGDGFAVDGIARVSGDQRRIRVPLSIVVTIRQELTAWKTRSASKTKLPPKADQLALD